MLNVPIRSRYTDTSSGYVKLYLADGSVVDEHRYVMTQELGRELLPDEVVHHKDQNKQNNNPENLELRDDSGHKAEHASKTHDEKHTLLKCAWCGKTFERLTRIVKGQRKRGHKKFYCSTSCVTKRRNERTKIRKERNRRRRDRYRQNKEFQDLKKD
jgi:hypothetical protein